MTIHGKPTQNEEDEFMRNILSGFGSSTPVAASPSVQHINSKHHNQTETTVQTHTHKRTENNVSSDDNSGLDLKTLFDGAEDWDWNDMELDIQEDTKKYLVVAIEGEQRSKSIQQRQVVLEHEWVQTEVAIGEQGITPKRKPVHSHNLSGDIVNIIGEWSPLLTQNTASSSATSTITIDSKTNLLILHPDLLLSATTISNAPSCTRRPLISLMLASNAPAPSNSVTTEAPVRTSPGESVVWGNFLHEVMQKCLASGKWDNQSIEDNVDEVVRSPTGLRELVKLGLGIEAAKVEVRARAGGLAGFSKRFIGPTINPDGKLTDTRDLKDTVSRLAITELHDVEEEIWSPTYGLKGKIDASVDTLISQGFQDIRKYSTSHTGKWTLPLEIKTGHSVNVMEHRAQTILYTLLVAERYDVQVPSGLLYYTHSDELLRIPAVRNEVKALLMARNELASYLMRKRTLDSEEQHFNDKPLLPPTLDENYKCNKCYVVNGCMLYRKAVENIQDLTSPIAELYAKKTSHLTQAQCDFFKRWEALVSMEEQDVVRFRQELWTMSAENREKKGRCFAHLIVRSYNRDDTPGIARMHQHVYRFVRATHSSERFISPSTQLQDGSLSLLNGSISVGDAVIISVDPDLIAVARGYVIELEPDYIMVGFDHEVDLRRVLQRARPKRNTLGGIICRIDKDEFGSGLGRIRDNLARLFYVHGDSKRLSLIVDLAPPQFDENDIIAGSGIPSHLNANQRAAVHKVLSARDYAMILGMPGTGKTSTIAEIINALVKLGKSVLLTSYTHSAVDTILLKLKDAEYSILRLGSVEKVHPDIHKFTLSSQPHATTIEQLEHQILRPSVVATTCLSVDHPLFARRYFDYCIVDEASQVTLPTCLGPLRYADRFVLVGDHFQLPPLIRSKEARLGGLDISLFRRLVEAHPEAVVDLVDQYRMNFDIMLLANTLIYSNRLRCGSEEVARRGLTLPNHSNLRSWCLERACPSSCWISKLINESRKVVFVDTDALPGLESHVGDLIQNESEAQLVCQFTNALLACGVSESQIGIISLYRQQVKLLSHLLHSYKGIEFLTADRSQGRDKDCIIISMVKSNTSGNTGELMKDWRRINVSFTRAKRKLIIFGSRSTLRGAPVLAEFFKIIESRGWIYSLTSGAHKLHENIPAQTASSNASGSNKRRSPESEINNENTIPGSISKKIKTKVDQGILKGRPLLRDIMNDISK
ncbi:hypothetical protein Clacol_007287 [Clathrus columnatus]|uniref:DNA replication ATP-dependent helicase/nuclease DNA2 n=1 Tax=Clathrus columnatus TaxID=1419009 RepID=A0AAV5AHR2_9AGAM|nr:hypothetical protein Clacol_007287 [Clathrus columnatus]